MKWNAANMWMLLAVVALAVLPLLFVNGEFGGADDAAEQIIQTLNPSYEPWFSSLYEPPAETESMLFALQAAIGAGIIGFTIGLYKGKLSKSKPQ